MVVISFSANVVLRFTVTGSMFTNLSRKALTNANFSDSSGCCCPVVSGTVTPEPVSAVTLPCCTRSNTGGRSCARIAEIMAMSATPHATNATLEARRA